MSSYMLSHEVKKQNYDAHIYVSVQNNKFPEVEYVNTGVAETLKSIGGWFFWTA